MKKLENVICKNHRRIVEEADVIGVLTIIDDIKQKSDFHNGLKMEIGRCGTCEREYGDYWFVECRFTNDQWRKFIKALNDYDYSLVLSTYEYYYVKEKVEGQK